MPIAIRARLPRLECSPEDSWEGERLIGEARDLFRLLKDTEARHVTRALRDPSFAETRFGQAQEELGSLRKAFGARARELSLHYGHSVRRELLSMAIMAEQAPLTTHADVEVIRRGRVAG